MPGHHLLEQSPSLERWDSRTRWLIIVAAVAPFVAIPFVPDHKAGLWLLIDLSSWAVFLVDFVVRQVMDRRYWRTGSGVFDLLIVVLTFPWYVFPAAETVAFMSVFRAARLIRLFTATQLAGKATILIARLGRLGLVLAGISLFSAIVVLNNEPPESGFANIGDALWWSVVSFTTVGYGDLYPVTPLGRFAGLLMMLTGLAALGTVSALLADAFRSDDAVELDSDDDEVDMAEVLAEVRALRTEVGQLRGQLAASNSSVSTDEQA